MPGIEETFTPEELRLVRAFVSWLRLPKEAITVYDAMDREHIIEKLERFYGTN
jgi:hypothetical protein